MNKIQYLEWDSKFFGYKIGKIIFDENINDTQLKFDQEDYQLIYLFSKEKLNNEFQKKINANLVDIKIEFIKKAVVVNSEFANHLEIKKINHITDDLLQLVYESGVYSRFKLDQNFKNNEFEKLYEAWINKALNDFNSMVIGAFIDSKIVGFISLGIKQGIADIGLIAVDEHARGKHLGTLLLGEANNFAIKNNSEYLTVVTQENNIQAMKFYERNGFSVDKKNYIYHLWKQVQ
jgi:dTDP-4-amino-4,6-dideoxy-D-galactose acyltransferase